jgi:hypothetical protein
MIMHLRRYFFIGTYLFLHSFLAHSQIIQSNANCDCLIPIDSTFSIVPFIGATPPEYRNDDGSSPMIQLPFSFCMFDQTLTNVYINNNGNITFNFAFGGFVTPVFPYVFNMIAPFFADVDTRNASSGIVYYKLTPSFLIVRWNEVGYNVMNVDKLNTFQLIISDGVDPIIPGGKTISLCYGDMQWTTGNSGNGTNGFGGYSAVAGVSSGDTTILIQIGKFNQPGNTYDGPFGDNDGIDWLDSSNFIFNNCLPDSVILDCNTDTVHLVTSIEQNDFTPFFLFSPNPFTEYVTLTIPNIKNNNTSLMIVDITGKEVRRLDHLSSSNKIEKENLSKGLYFYQILNGNSVYAKGKLIIE